MTCTHDAFAAFGIKIDASDLLKVIFDNELSQELLEYAKKCKERLEKEWDEHKKEWDKYSEEYKEYKEYKEELELAEKNNPNPDIYTVKRYAIFAPTKPCGKRYDTYDDYVDNVHFGFFCALEKEVFYWDDDCFHNEPRLTDMAAFDILTCEQCHVPMYFVVPSGIDVGSEIDPDSLKKSLALFEKYFEDQPELHCVRTGCSCC